MALLNVNPADLYRAADDYTELAARTAQLLVQALAEIQRIAASHGPMGFPTAVGVAARMAARESAVQAKAAQLEQYADNFSGHAGAYIDQDRAAAATFDALDVPASPRRPQAATRSAGAASGGVLAAQRRRRPGEVLPRRTTRIEYVDDKGQWIQKTSGPAPTRSS